MPPIATNIVEIGRAVAARLNLLSVVPDPSQILWSARRGDLPHLKGQKDLILRPRRNQDIKANSGGGGRYGIVCIRVLDLILRTSNGLGDAGSDEKWIEQHTAFEDQVFNALVEQMLVVKDDLNTQTQEYLTCPLKYLGTTEEVRDAQPPTANLWGNSIISLECHYKPKLDVSQVA